MSERFTTEIPVRHSDYDTYGHVNNATYATYLEEARANYLEAVLADEDLTSNADDGDVETIGVVVANLEIDFHRSIETTDVVTVAVAVGEMGTSSFILEYEIRSADGVHANAKTTMVAFDRQARESLPLPESWRNAIDAFEPISAE